MASTELETRTFTVVQLLDAIRKGRVRLPHFQRGYRWTDDDLSAMRAISFRRTSGARGISAMIRLTFDTVRSDTGWSGSYQTTWFVTASAGAS